MANKMESNDFFNWICIYNPVNFLSLMYWIGSKRNDKEGGGITRKREMEEYVVNLREETKKKRKKKKTVTK